jgi:hypothetical protein
MSDAPKTETLKRGNRNAMRHGLKAGKLPTDCQHIEIACNVLRRQLEDAVVKARGQVSLTDAATIQSALRWERHSALALRWLRIQGDKLSASDRLRFSEAIAKASDNRDRNIRMLGLDRDEADDMVRALYARPGGGALPIQALPSADAGGGPALPHANGAGGTEGK